MLTYDYVEITETMFLHITEVARWFETIETPNGFKEYYKAFGQTIIKVRHDDINLTQYFINSAHPV